MKKLLLILAIGAFASCNNEESTTTSTDSLSADSLNTVAPLDTTGTGTGTMDTTSTGTGSGQ